MLEEKIMKKYLNVIFASMAALAVLAACQKTEGNDTPENTDTPVAKEVVTISASMPAEGLTKVALTQGENKKVIKLAWENNDVIKINGNDFTIIPATIANDGKTASFSGTAPDPVGGKYDISYTDLPGDFNDQTQSADGDTEHLGYAVALNGASDYASFEFSETGAGALGAILSQSSVLSLRALLPDGIAATVQKVIFKASAAVFDGDNTLTVNITTPGDTGDDDLLQVYATLPAGDVTLTADTDLLVQFQVSANAYDKYTAYRSFASGTDFIVSGKNQYLGINCSNIDKYAGSADDGTAAHPYLIADQHQMQAMSGLLIADQKKYFKLVDDVYMTGVSWSPLSGTSVFTKGVDFDGNNKTIYNLSSTGQYASFFGVLNGAAYDVTFDNATISSSNQKAGVVAAFLGSATSSVSASCHGITVQNSSVTNTARHAGGFAGIADMLSAPLDDCHVINTTVTGMGGDNQDSRAGGLLGEFKAGFTCKNSTAEGVTVSGSKNVGGLIGVAYGTVQNCWSSGSISSPNTTTNIDIALGGLAGYFENGTITKCHSSVTINQTTNGRDIGGLVGKMLAGTIEKSYATGNVSGIQRNVGGLVGLVTLTSGTATISNCYCTGTVNGTGGYSGGFLGLHEKGTANITNSYSTSAVTGSFGLGGIVGFIGSAGMTVGKCAAWNSAITPSSSGSENWSSGAVVGITFPTCTLTDNYRNPSMPLTAYWVPAADYNHANVSSSHPLVKQNGVETTATSTAKGQDGYPQFPYHGKVETGKTLSQLASTTLGWSGDVWDFSGPLPLLN